MKKAGVVFIVVGVLSLLVQNTFYGYIDNDGVLRDSIFLPVGAFSLLLGLLAFAVSGVQYFLTKRTQNKK